MLKNIFLVGCGSFFGGGARFFFSKYVQNRFETSFPFGTYVVNILGCFLIGLFSGLFAGTGKVDATYMLLLVTGFCGGFTTFSTFMNESYQLFKAANYFYFAIYLILSVVCGLFAVYLGYMIVNII